MKTSRALLQAIRRNFSIRNDVLYRKGKPIEKVGEDHQMVFVGKVGGKNTWRLMYRVKFCVAHGYLPVTVDHRDRDRRNNSLSNLRAASYTEQNFNSRHKSTLPRGVYRTGYPRKKFGARATNRFSQMVYLGSFEKISLASTAVEEFARKEHGKFYLEGGGHNL